MKYNKPENKKDIYAKACSRFIIIIWLVTGFWVNSSYSVNQLKDYPLAASSEIIPLPKQADFEGSYFTFIDTLYLFFDNEELTALLPVLQDEFRSMYQTAILRASEKKQADLFFLLDDSMDKESYHLEVKERITVTGGSYRAVAMGTVSVLQLVSGNEEARRIPHCKVYDYPDLPFRGLMVDVARRKHSIEVLKQIVSLCRWYKINYLQLHLTDEHYFSFPSAAFPQLSTDNFHFTKEELNSLVDFADARGVELIPELEVPGHAGQFVEQMPEVFGFSNEKLNRYTINMARDEIYPVLDTLIGEIASVFHSSQYIHIGGDEADFSGMDQEPEMKQYLQEKELKSVEELFWHFINRMNAMVQKRNKTAIVWEGFAKEGNELVSKDIIVMAWETMYQLPSDLLEAGYRIINVSWQPLYVVNNRKWSPEEIYSWNVYQWQNWFPKAPSFDTIQIDEHPNVQGASMASWDQPEYVEISSLRKRLPAMAERVWNINRRAPAKDFLAAVDKLDDKLSNYFSPVNIHETGRRFPEISDGYRHEQVWFGDTLTILMDAPGEFFIRYALDEAVTERSSVYRDPLKLSETTTFRYQAFTSGGEPVGHEIVKYYELHPIEVSFKGDHLFTEEEYWNRIESWKFPYTDSLMFFISSFRPGQIKYQINGQQESGFEEYKGPFVITEDAYVRAGLFVNDTLTGELWMQHFDNINNN